MKYTLSFGYVYYTHTCVCTNRYIHTCVYLYVHFYIYICICICLYISLYLYIYVSICIGIRIRYVCVYVYVHMCMCICDMCICILHLLIVIISNTKTCCGTCLSGEGEEPRQNESPVHAGSLMAFSIESLKTHTFPYIRLCATISIEDRRAMLYQRRPQDSLQKLNTGLFKSAFT